MTAAASLGRIDHNATTTIVPDTSASTFATKAANGTMTAATPLLVIGMCALMQGVGGGLGWSVMPALMPTIAKDLHLGHAAGGFVFGAASLGIAIASPIGGAAVDRFGARRVAGFAMLAGALACAARAFATGTWSLAFAMLVFGLHIGFTAPAIPKALFAHVNPARVARANGFALTAYTLGTAATIMLAKPVLLPLFGSWRAVMVGSGVAMSLAAMLWLALVRNGSAVARHAKVTDAISIARDGQVLRVAFMHFLLFGGYLSLLSLLPRALMDSGMAPLRVGPAIAAWLVAAGIANYAGPWLSDVIGRRRVMFIGGALLAAAALAGVSVCAAWAPSKAPIFLVIAALGGGSFAPLLLTLPLELPNVGPARAGAALGLLMLVGQVGGFLLPVVSGAMAQASGSPAALAVLAVVHLLVIVPAIGLRTR